MLSYYHILEVIIFDFFNNILNKAKYTIPKKVVAIKQSELIRVTDWQNCIKCHEEKVGQQLAFATPCNTHHKINSIRN